MIPEDKWTKNQREFVGSTFNTPKGGVLTVVGVDSKNKQNNYIFSVECSVCSKDKELWGDIFLSTKGNLVKGKTPCGCSSKVLTDNQDKLLLNRYLRSIGSTLIAEDVIKEAGSTNRKFILTCSVCSQDKELWPYGSLVSYKGHLKEGKLPCGCSPTTRWSDEQYKIKVNRECIKRGYIFHGWAEVFKGRDTKVRLSNPDTGNIWETTTARSFLKGGGDPSESACGFNNSKPAAIYVNKFYQDRQPFILKFGITNRNTRDRLLEQERNSGLKGETVLSFHSKDGKFIENIERVLKTTIALDRVSCEDLPDGFTEAVYYKPNVEVFVLNYIEMLVGNK